VTDRLVQQAIAQVLGPRYDAGFSPHSHGFRPNHSAHDAVMEAQGYIQEGYDWVVDVDLERFFDRVNHDVLMGRLERTIEDKRMLRILRGFLNAGVMLNGVVIDQDEGTPQGGPLSPLLANVLLDEIDKILEARGHRFVRYADDCNVYVRSEKAGLRVMATMQKELGKLRLRINEAKSAVDRPWNRRFLGFTFRRGREPRRRVSPRAIEKAKDRIRELTNRNRGASLTTVVKELTTYLRGWRQYFGICQVPSPRRDLDEWIRARLRLLQVKQWKRGRTAYRALVALGASGGAASRRRRSFGDGGTRLTRQESASPCRSPTSTVWVCHEWPLEPPGADPHAGWCGRGSGISRLLCRSAFDLSGRASRFRQCPLGEMHECPQRGRSTR
jgi:group II intron reverse transcriptase/maturase